ncbi:hypothetical protein NKH36_32465 [Mesorhizobium sp. M1312]|uniref:hypothetical protein n=1 Tax=unclassified Mesorhizobium TaxID=325217 RepID=UPI0033387544
MVFGTQPPSWRRGKVAPPQFVGIGASAGGIAVFKILSRGRTDSGHAYTDSGHAYIVIHHLDAEHKSELASIIQGCAQLESRS